jgi:TnpA family transposase
LLVHCHASILAQACNFGLTRMAQLADLSYRQLAWCTTWYLREETLKPAIASIVDRHYRHPLARLWGGGTLSSSDGQRFPVAVRSQTATAIPRYFGYGRGLTFYTWTSDQFSQYGSKPIPSTVRDATYVLDGILDNETELPIDEHTSDTAGYTDLVFSLFDLLGLQFSPRLRDLGDQQLYRIDTSIRYQNIGPLVRGIINTRLILEHWDDLLRVTGSLKLGWVTASLFIAKLQSFRRQNVLTRALQEYGRLNKTIFILRYLLDEQFQRRIGVQINKGEALHALRGFLFVANEGQIRRRYYEEQLNQVSCLNLVTNAVVLKSIFLRCYAGCWPEASPRSAVSTNLPKFDAQGSLFQSLGFIEDYLFNLAKALLASFRTQALGCFKKRSMYGRALRAFSLASPVRA